MNKQLLRTFMAVNTFLIRVSRGKIGSQLGTQTILLLHTTGRKSGKSFVTPIAYFKVENSFFIVASNWGQEKNAAWYYNLKQRPATMIEVGGRALNVLSHEADGEEYQRLWNYAVNHHPPYEHYRDMTKRHIPIIVLVPDQTL